MVSKEEFKKLLEKEKEEYEESVRTIKRVGLYGLGFAFLVFFVFFGFNLFAMFNGSGGISFNYNLWISPGVALIISFVFAFISGVIEAKKSREALEKFKEKIINILFDGHKKEYKAKGFIEWNEINISSFTKKTVSKNVSDLIKINIPLKNKEPSESFITICDCKAWSTDDIKKEKMNIISVRFDSEFKSNIYVNMDNPGDGFHAVKFESIEFNRKFKVYCDNELETRVLFNPKTIDDFLAMNVAKKDFKMLLKGNVLFASFGKNLFEPKFQKKSVEEILHFYDEAQNIVKFIDILSENQRQLKLKQQRSL